MSTPAPWTNLALVGVILIGMSGAAYALPQSADSLEPLDTLEGMSALTSAAAAPTLTELQLPNTVLLADDDWDDRDDDWDDRYDDDDDDDDRWDDDDDDDDRWDD